MTLPLVVALVLSFVSIVISALSIQRSRRTIRQQREQAEVVQSLKEFQAYQDGGPRPAWMDEAWKKSEKSEDEDEEHHQVR